jgi:AraC-like DNA-binding protein
MMGPPVRGSLAFAAHEGVIFSSGLIQTKVAVNGPLSHDAITVTIGLKFGPGSRLWLNTVNEGDVGIFQPGDEHDAFYTHGSLYVAATLPADRLEEEASREGISLDRRTISRTGLYERPLTPYALTRLRGLVANIHSNHDIESNRHREVGHAMLRAVLEHCAWPPVGATGRTHPMGRARIVHCAREYIRENLAAPIKLDDIAAAAETSRRTLSRAFFEVLGDAPGRYVQRLRLHRIRRELASEDEIGCTISLISERWGISEPGRMAGWYRKLFGESPSKTLATHLARPPLF